MAICYTGFGKKTPPVHRQVSVRQYCAESNEAIRNCMELIVRSLAKQYGVTEQPNGMGTVDERMQGTGRRYCEV